MTSNEIIKADLLDIIFDGRNKQYGAYDLRRSYSNRLTLSVGIALSLCLLLVLIRPARQGDRSILQEKPELVARIIEIPKAQTVPPPSPPPAAPVPRQPRAIASLTSVLNMVDEVDPTRAFDDLNNMKETDIGNINLTGPKVTDIIQPKVPEEVSDKTGTGSGKDKEEPFDPVEKQPEFPGGMQAWIAFLTRHLQTPDELEAGEKKTVVVSFIVDKDGSVTGFKVAQSGGRRFDEEVIRVLRKMPKWKPAIQNGNAVELMFTQPVTFVGVEQ
jgi:protein TonB